MYAFSLSEDKLSKLGLGMNSVISVDLSEVITIDAELSSTTEELLELVTNQHFLIDVSLEHSLPRLRRYAEDNFGCVIELNTLCTIEGHTSVEVRLKHFAVKMDESITLSVLTEDGLVSLLKDIIKTLAALLPLPCAICSQCDTRHKCMRCP